MRRPGRVSWHSADAHSSQQRAGVGDQSDECRNDNEDCPDENGLPCLECLFDSEDEIDTSGTTNQAEEVEGQ